jgi:hypothetical protein
MGVVISLPFREISRHSVGLGSDRRLRQPATIAVDCNALQRIRRNTRHFFRGARAIRKCSPSATLQSELRAKIDIARTELEKKPGPRRHFPFFIRKRELIDPSKIAAAFDKLVIPAGHALDFFFNCLPNFTTGQGVVAEPVIYLRKTSAPAMPVLVADLELRSGDLTRASLNKLRFDKSPAGLFQMAVLYKILVEPQGLIGVNSVFEWDGSVFPGREKVRGWLQDISATVSRADFARLWEIDPAPALWLSNEAALVKFDVLAPNHGYFQHYGYIRSNRVVGFESLALVRVEPNFVF